MGRAVAHGGTRPRRILDQHQPADKIAQRFAEGPLTKSHPEIDGGANGFLGTIVEVVAEVWPYLGFQREGRHEV